MSDTPETVKTEIKESEFSHVTRFTEVPSQDDDELDALALCVNVLEAPPLDAFQRNRILAYLQDRYMLVSEDKSDG